MYLFTTFTPLWGSVWCHVGVTLWREREGCLFNNSEAMAAAATTTGGWKRRYDCEDPFRLFRHLREEIKCVKISQHRLTKKQHFQEKSKIFIS